MGLMDILNGMQNGPGGQRQPAPSGGGSSGGMSPMMMALLGLLAYKAVKGGGLGNILGGSSSPSAPPAGHLPGGSRADASGGGLGDILGGMLGGGAPGQGAPGGLGGGRAGAPGGGLGDLLGGMLGGGAPGQSAPGGGLGGLLGGLLGGGAAAGTVLNGGLKNLLGEMEENGHADVADSWVSNGPNKSVSPGDLGKAIGVDDVDAVARQAGMSRDDMLAMLSQNLPDLVNQLTPNGRLPSDHEASRW